MGAQAREALQQALQLLPRVFAFDVHVTGASTAVSGYLGWLHTYLDFAQHCQASLHGLWSQALHQACDMKAPDSHSKKLFCS